MKAALISLFVTSILFSSVASAREIIVLETFTGVQYSNQLETPSKAYQPQLKLSDLSQNLTSGEIESLYVFKYKIEHQKDDLHCVAELILSIAFPRLIIPF